MPGSLRSMLLAAVLALLTGCSILPWYSHVNEPAGATPPTRGIGESDTVPSGADVASEAVRWTVDVACRDGLVIAPNAASPRVDSIADCPTTDGNFVALALSGGGSRAAVLSAQVIFELERYGLLRHVDVISSVSGGSYTAALYAVSCDRDPAHPCPETVEGTDRPRWHEDEVFPVLQRNYIGRWIGNWFWPENLLRYWLTYYDRTDIMAETLADNLFDTSLLGNEGFRMQDLNPQRPHLLINATDNTFFDHAANVRRHRNAGRQEALNFTFTREHFAKIRSNLDRYPIAYAVAASSAFPGAFQYVTLQDFSSGDERYVHLLDGGTSDNLGLGSLARVLRNQPPAARANALVILVDAYVPPVGRDGRSGEPRTWVDHFVDTNFLDAYDTLMTNLREQEVVAFKKALGLRDEQFVWLKLETLDPVDPKLYGVVSDIKTDLAIEEDDAICLRVAARLLVERSLDTLRGPRPDRWRPPPAEAAPPQPLPDCKTERPKPEDDAVAQP